MLRFSVKPFIVVVRLFLVMNSNNSYFILKIYETPCPEIISTKYEELCQVFEEDAQAPMDLHPYH